MMGGGGGDTLPLYRACKDHNNIDCILTDTYHCFSLRGTRVHEWGWGGVGCNEGTTSLSSVLT